MKKTDSTKQLLYSIIFFTAAVLWFFFNPLDQIRDFIELSPNEWTIKQAMFELGVFPIFYNVANIALMGSVVFLFSSLYTGISLKKAFDTRA